MPSIAPPAPVTGKRKRTAAPVEASSTETLHITVGSYERVLHGFIATIPAQALSDQPVPSIRALKSPAEQKSSAQPNDIAESGVTFTDAFLLAPHSSSIRAVAVSSELHGKRYIASGGADEHINVYQIGSVAPRLAQDVKQNKKQKHIVEAEAEKQAALAGRELGTLTPHTATITGLSFCGHAKLLSTSLDNSICVTRTRDWTPLTTLRAPHPQSSHRPDGDTFAPVDGPAGVMSCGVHPSFKLAVSVGIGERTMRLWDLVKGKRAGVLAFERKVLQDLGEWGGLRDGEGRQVQWDEKGEKYVVAFEKGVAVFDVTCKIIGVAKIGPREKVGCARWVTDEVLAVATERGRVLLLSASEIKKSVENDADDNAASAVPALRPLSQLIEAHNKSGTMSRIKDFQIISTGSAEGDEYYIVTGSSDGAVRTYRFSKSEMETASRQSGGDRSTELPVLGKLLATYETGHRITCVAAFKMDSGPLSPSQTRTSGSKVTGADVGTSKAFTSKHDDLPKDDELDEDNSIAHTNAGKVYSNKDAEEEFDGFEDD